MKKRVFPFIENLSIIDAASEGIAVGRHNDHVIFVSNAVPGDVCDVQVFSKRKSFMEGKATVFHTYSDKRESPFCEHFGVCGGCKWQNMKYEHQLYFKQKNVSDSLQRIGKVDISEMKPILASENTTYYRNKLEYTFSNKRWLEKEDMETGRYDKNLNGLGFHIPKLFDKVLDINHCWLQNEISNRIRNAVREYAFKHELTFFDIRAQTGFLRNLLVRSSSTGDLMVILVFAYNDDELQKNILDFIGNSFPEISSLMFVVNTKRNDTISDQVIELHKGNPFIMEKMDDLQFKIGPVSFYQTNSIQAHNLYKITKSLANLTGNEIVYDLYTGTGTIANFIAKDCKKVVGIEYVPSAIDDAHENSRINEINNTVFYAGDIAKVLNDEFVAINGKPEIIITDPPRAGMHADVVKQILNIEPLRIVYVSCNPATQARDIELMSEKYSVVEIQPVDMFPHTQHVENVVLLVRK
ncbi:MAG: 23S rRNA (uracil(1939)-C(5))-methyltransferase RlmD [Bacteroidetes bacterium]|nr:23S rRNA (uracil(1939)-C(5))-methyltransferase RlmD [Bacteroidota bacterium]